MKRLFLFILLILGAFDAIPLAHAQLEQFEPPNKAKLSPEIQAQIAAKLGIGVNSPFMQKIVAAQNNPSGGSPPKQHAPAEVSIHKHIAREEGGAFPEPVRYFEKLDRQGLEQLSDKATQDMDRQLRAQLQPKSLPECSGTKTVKSAVSKKNIKGSQTLMDILWVRASDIPQNPEEIVGVQPRIIPYRDDVASEGSLSALGVGVNCLPYRIRLTNNKSYIHLGLDALRNYDLDPDGKGELNPLAKDQFKLQRGM